MASPISVFRGRDYRLYAFNRLFSFLNVTLLQSAIAWQVYEISGSAFQLGLIGLFRFVPSLTLSLVGGSVADVFDRRRIVLAAQLVPFAASIVLAAATAGGNANLTLIYILSSALSAGNAFEFPARQALLPQVVPLALFPTAVTANSVVHQVGFVTGPALAGVLIAGSGLEAAYIAIAIVVSIAIALYVPLRPNRGSLSRRCVSIAAIVEGVRFVLSRQILLAAMTLNLFAVIFGGAAALLPVYANDILDVGAHGYGLLAAAAEVGALGTGLVLIFMRPIRSAGRALIVAVFFYGAATIVFGLSRALPLSLVAYAVTDMADEISVVMRHTAVQLSTPDELRGRVNSVNQVFIGASNQLAAVESGFVAALTSATFAVVSGGVGLIIVLMAVVRLMPELRGYRLVTTAIEVPPAGHVIT